MQRRGNVRLLHICNGNARRSLYAVASARMARPSRRGVGDHGHGAPCSSRHDTTPLPHHVASKCPPRVRIHFRRCRKARHRRCPRVRTPPRTSRALVRSGECRPSARARKRRPNVSMGGRRRVHVQDVTGTPPHGRGSLCRSRARNGRMQGRCTGHPAWHTTCMQADGGTWWLVARRRRWNRVSTAALPSQSPHVHARTQCPRFHTAHHARRGQGTMRIRIKGTWGNVGALRDR